MKICLWLIRGSFRSWPAGDPFSGSWWSKVGAVVDICALGLRDAVDKRGVMVLTLGSVKAGSPSTSMQLNPQTSLQGRHCPLLGTQN